MTTPREEWHRQVDDIADAYLETALRRGEAVTVVLRIDITRDVMPAKISIEHGQSERTERVKA